MKLCVRGQTLSVERDPAPKRILGGPRKPNDSNFPTRTLENPGHLEIVDSKEHLVEKIDCKPADNGYKYLVDLAETRNFCGCSVSRLVITS